MFNRWNLIHLIAPFIALTIAAFVLNSKPALSNGGQYYPAVYLFFSTVIIFLGGVAALANKENLHNFVVFLPVYPFWFFAVLMAYFPIETTYGAIGSFSLSQ